MNDGLILAGILYAIGAAATGWLVHKTENPDFGIFLSVAMGLIWPFSLFLVIYELPGGASFLKIGLEFANSRAEFWNNQSEYWMSQANKLKEKLNKIIETIEGE